MTPEPATTTRFSIADALTVGNGVAGFLGLLVLAGLWLAPDGGVGTPLGEETLRVCALLYVTGMVLDSIDGPVARRFGSSGLGPALDTMGDVVTFGLLPAALVVSRTEPSSALLAVAVLYVVAVLVRLARHAREEGDRAVAEATGTTVAARGHHGMPSPPAGNCLVALAALAPDPWIATAVVAVLTGLMLGDFPFPPLRGVAAGYVVAMVVLCLLAIAELVPKEVPAYAVIGVLLPVAIAGRLHLMRAPSAGLADGPR